MALTNPELSPAPSLDPARIAGWSIGLAILFIVVGVFAILIPIVSGIAITLIVGWVITMAGLLHLLFAWRARAAGTKLWEILVGVVYIAGGIWLLVHPMAGLTSLTLLLATYLLFKGVFEIIHYFQVSPRRGLLPLILDGIINLVLAILIWSQWPFSSVWVIGTLVGLSILFSGISRLMLSMETRRALSPL